MATQSKLRSVLERIAAELKDEEAQDELAELREEIRTGGKLSIADLRDLIAEAPAEERAELRALLAEAADDEPPTPPRQRKPAATYDEPPAGDPPPPDPNRRVRPGRKSGNAYDWGVDEETGEIVKAPMAYIFTGDDEPDEVELMPVTTREAEDDDDADE